MDQLESTLLWIVLAGAAVAAVIGIFKAFKTVNRFFEKTNRFLDDWYGRPAEDGHPKQMGVLHRLDELEANRKLSFQTLENISTDVTEVKKQVGLELNRNGGGTVKDAAFNALRVSEESLKVAQQIQIQQEEEIKERKDWMERYEKTQVEQRMERTAIFASVAEMIGKDPNEQLTLWRVTGEKWTNGTLHTGDIPGMRRRYTDKPDTPESD